MFLNDLSIYSIPVIGIVVLLIGLRSSIPISLFNYQLSSRSKKQQHVNKIDDNAQHAHVSIQIHPSSKPEHVDSNRSAPPMSPFDDDDDEELIKSDISSISVSNFCENSSIELRVNQDFDYDNDLSEEENH